VDFRLGGERPAAFPDRPARPAAAGMLAWPHSGFGAHVGPRIEDRAGRLRVARYGARAAVAESLWRYDAARAEAERVSDRSEGPYVARPPARLLPSRRLAFPKSPPVAEDPLMSRDSSDPTADSPAELQRRLAELGNLHEVARSLLGARDPERVASRTVLATMGSFGALSGAMFMVDERGRFRLVYAYGPGDVEYGEVLPLDGEAREWMLREGVFALAGPATPRALGSAPERLHQRYGAVVGVAIADAHGLAGLLVLGPRLNAEAYDADDLALLDSLAGLAALALGNRSPRERAGTSRAQAPRRAVRSFRALRAQQPALELLKGDSPVLLEACEDLVAVARTRFPVLLSGESGVGKELAAQAIHTMSERASGPFELVDCGSIPRELIESELFGHVRGSFTGAHRDRRGAFELAHRGTLFLDEVGEMPLQLQTRLLRFLQEGRFRRVGDEQPIESDVRVVTATNRDLRAEVAGKRFREDLFYRLNVFAVRLPPLRERLEDLEPLMRHFLPRLERGAGWTIEEEALTALRSYAWPGNVRELANICATLAVRSGDRGRVGLDDLEVVWRRQHPGEPVPWQGGTGAPRGRLGDWVLERARESRFNLIEASRQLRRRKRAGQPAPLTERSALSYYVTGEILKALVDAGGDADAAARAIAGDEDLVPRVAARVSKIIDVLRAADGDRATMRRRFGKLPSGYETVLERAAKLMT